MNVEVIPSGKSVKGRAVRLYALVARLAMNPRPWAVLTALVLSAPYAMADSVQGMPWENALVEIADALNGPIARTAVLVAIVIFGILLAVGEMKGVFKTAATILFGASIALSAMQWLNILGAYTGSYSSAGCITTGACQ